VAQYPEAAVEVRRAVLAEAAVEARRAVAVKGVVDPHGDNNFDNIIRQRIDLQWEPGLPLLFSVT
jgi:hypothetical protein